VLVATHDPEFAVAFAQRVVLMGEGEIIADDDPHQVLAGGWYFATETARVCGALTPAEGAELLRPLAAARPAVRPEAPQP
jgi:energy-coupling factor transport system ATP-binding protein